LRPDQPTDPSVSLVDLPTGPMAITDNGEDGLAVILIHGLPGSHRDYRWFEPVLPGVRIIRPDLPGFGATPLSTQPGADLASRGRTIAALLDALDLEKAVLVGHSMGGGVATAAARISSRVVGLALLASIGIEPHRERRRFHPRLLARAIRAPILGRAMLPLARIAFQKAGFKIQNATELLHTLDCVAETRFDTHTDNLAAIQVPTFVSWANDDRLIEPEIFAQLSKAAPPGPRLGFDVGGHNIQKTQAVEIADAFLPWLQSLA
jgi:pimeloyl-ACP methyl ester carboxylesterase